MTEEEAKTKLCPFAARFNASRFPWYRDDDDGIKYESNEPAFCVASACMAWRARLYLSEESVPRPDDKKPGREWYPDYHQGEPVWAKAVHTLGGFCGLASARD